MCKMTGGNNLNMCIKKKQLKDIICMCKIYNKESLDEYKQKEIQREISIQNKTVKKYSI